MYAKARRKGYWLVETMPGQCSGGHEILSQEAIKYHRVKIDTRLSFKQHLATAAEKATERGRSMTEWQKRWGESPADAHWSWMLLAIPSPF